MGGVGFGVEWGELEADYPFGGDVAGGVDVELDCNVDGAADGGARSLRNFGHHLREHFALGDGFSGRLDARGISDVG